MRSTASRFSKLLLMSVTLSLMPLNVWGQIKVFPEQPVVGKDTKFVLLSDRKSDVDITWTFQSISNQDNSNTPASKNGRQPLETVKFSEGGKYLIVASFQTPTGAATTAVQEVKVISGGATGVKANLTSKFNSKESSDDVVLNAGETVSESKLGFTEFTLTLLLSDETQVDSRDQKFLESCAAIAKIFADRAAAAPNDKLDALVPESQARMDVETLVNDTNGDILSELKRIHPNWEIFSRANGGRRSPGQLAWKNFLTSFGNQMTEIIDINKGASPDADYINSFSFREAWMEVSNAFKIAATKKESYIMDYNENREIYESYMRNNPGGINGQRIYTGPKCPLLIPLRLF